MKKLIFPLVIGMFSMALVSFIPTENDRYPSDLPTAYTDFFQKDYIHTVENTDLRTELETNFITLFDQVNRVDAQYNEDFDYYYYLVIGEKEGIAKVELLKIKAEDFQNGTYTYIDFSQFEATEAVEYCLEGPDSSTFPFVCIGPCLPRDNNCLGLICGVRFGEFCFSQQ